MNIKKSNQCSFIHFNKSKWNHWLTIADNLELLAVSVAIMIIIIIIIIIIINK